MNVFEGELHLELRFDYNSEAFCLNNLLCGKIAQLEAEEADPELIGKYQRVQKLTSTILDDIIWCEVSHEGQTLEASTAAVLHSRPILDQNCYTVFGLLMERVADVGQDEQLYGWECAQAQAMITSMADITPEAV